MLKKIKDSLKSLNLEHLATDKIIKPYIAKLYRQKAGNRNSYYMVQSVIEMILINKQ